MNYTFDADAGTVSKDGHVIVHHAQVSTDVWALILAGVVAMNPDGPIRSAHAALSENPPAPYKAKARLARYITATGGTP